MIIFFSSSYLNSLRILFSYLYSTIIQMSSVEYVIMNAHSQIRLRRMYVCRDEEIRKNENLCHIYMQLFRQDIWGFVFPCHSLLLDEFCLTLA